MPFAVCFPAAVTQGAVTFYTGAALGVDLRAADMVSGTGQTIRTAMRQGLDVRLLTIGDAAQRQKAHPYFHF